MRSNNPGSAPIRRLARCASAKRSAAIAGRRVCHSIDLDAPVAGRDCRLESRCHFQRGPGVVRSHRTNLRARISKAGHSKPGNAIGRHFQHRLLESEFVFGFGKDMPSWPRPYARSEIIDGSTLKSPALVCVHLNRRILRKLILACSEPSRWYSPDRHVAFDSKAERLDASKSGPRPTHYLESVSGLLWAVCVGTILDASPLLLETG